MWYGPWFGGYESYGENDGIDGVDIVDGGVGMEPIGLSAIGIPIGEGPIGEGPIGIIGEGICPPIIGGLACGYGWYGIFGGVGALETCFEYPPGIS